MNEKTEKKVYSEKQKNILKIIILIFFAIIFWSIAQSALDKPKEEKFIKSVDEFIAQNGAEIVTSHHITKDAGAIHIKRKIWDSESNANKLDFMKSISLGLTGLKKQAGFKIDSYYPITFYDEYNNKLGKVDFNGSAYLE